MKQRKRQITEGIELLNQERIWTPLGEKENYKYRSILEADLTKQVQMKKKLRKNISDERENFQKLDLKHLDISHITFYQIYDYLILSKRDLKLWNLSTLFISVWKTGTFILWINFVKWLMMHPTNFLNVIILCTLTPSESKIGPWWLASISLSLSRSLSLSLVRHVFEHYNATW